MTKNTKALALALGLLGLGASAQAVALDIPLPSDPATNYPPPNPPGPPITDFTNVIYSDGNWDGSGSQPPAHTESRSQRTYTYTGAAFAFDRVAINGESGNPWNVQMNWPELGDVNIAFTLPSQLLLSIFLNNNLLLSAQLCPACDQGYDTDNDGIVDAYGWPFDALGTPIPQLVDRSLNVPDTTLATGDLLEFVFWENTWDGNQTENPDARYSNLMVSLQCVGAGCAGGGGGAPEPATLALLGLGLAGLRLRWRSRV